MGFFDLPTSSTQNMQDFAWRYQFLQAVAERAAAAAVPSGIGGSTSINGADARAQIVDYDHADTVPPRNPVAGEKWLVVYSATNGERNGGTLYAPPSNTPPASPAVGVYYAVDSAPTGVWSDKANSLARWTARRWVFYTPKDRNVYKYGTNPYPYYVFREGQWGLVGPQNWASQQGKIAEWNGSNWTFSDPPSADLVKFFRVDGRYYRRVQKNGLNYSAPSDYLFVPAMAYKTAGGSSYFTDYPLGPTFLQDTIERLAPYYTRPIESGYVGIGYTPVGYKMCDFWADVGVAAEGRPAEDIIMMSSPPTRLGSLSFGYLWVEGVRIAVHGTPTLSYEFIGHEGDIATLHKTWDEEETQWVHSYTFETPPDGYIINGYGLDQYGNCQGGSYYKRDATAASWVATTEVGWTRKRPRTISWLDAEGEAGQRARLVVTTNGMNGLPSYFTYLDGVRSDPPEAPSSYHGWCVAAGATGAWAGHDGELAYWYGSYWIFVTPTVGKAYIVGGTRASSPQEVSWDHNTDKAYISFGGDWLYLGPGADMYEHDGTGWQFATDQFSPPDTITIYGKAQPGDYLTTDIFDQMHAALILLHRRTTLSYPSYNHRPQGWTLDLVRAGGIHWGSIYSSAGRYKPWYNFVPNLETWEEVAAAAIARWNNLAWSSTSGTEIGTHNSVGHWHDGRPWCIYMGRTQRMLYSRFAQPGINAGKNVNVSFYAVGDIINWGSTDPDDEPNDWSNHGDNIARGTSVLVEEFTGVGKAYEYHLSNWYGSDESAPVQPWGTYDGPDCGYEMKAIFAVEEWAAEGGFEYQ